MAKRSRGRPICNHDRYVSSQGYILVRDKTGLYGTQDAFVLEHRLVMGMFLGRPLRTDEFVHHIDKNKQNNSIDNLILVTPQSHGRHHRGEKRTQKDRSMHYSFEGKSEWAKCRCPNCHRIFYRPTSQLLPNKTGLYFCSNRCATVFIESGMRCTQENIICRFMTNYKFMRAFLSGKLGRWIDISDNGKLIQ